MPHTAQKKPLWLAAAPALFLLLWSFGFVFLKLGLAYADPFTFLALRYACVVAILAIPCLWVRPPLPSTPQAWMHLSIVGLLVQAGYFSFAYLSLKQGVTAGALAIITAQQPLLVGLLAPAVASERVGLIRWIGLLMGVAGAGIVILAKSTVEVASTTALLFGVLALVCMTGGTLWEKRYGTEEHPITSNMIQYSVGLAVAAPLAFLLEPMQVQWTPGLFVSLAYLVVGNSLVAITLLLAMIRRGEASRVSALFCLVPPTTALLAFPILREAIPVLAWPGMVLAAAGIYLVMRKS